MNTPSATVSAERLDYLIDLTIGRDTKAALRELKSARQLLACCGPYLRHDDGCAAVPHRRWVGQVLKLVSDTCDCGLDALLAALRGMAGEDTK